MAAFLNGRDTSHGHACVGDACRAEAPDTKVEAGPVAEIAPGSYNGKVRFRRPVQERDAETDGALRDLHRPF